MQTVMMPANLNHMVNSRGDQLFEEHRDYIYRRTDRLFLGLLLLQWAAAIIVALWLSPRSWAGETSTLHVHVWAALGLGGAIICLPVLLACRYPGRVATRHTIAVSQALMSALLIHLSGGRIETHFHIFGSLALLAFYRDWKVLVSASLVVAIDHFLRGTFWPRSVFGEIAVSPWRWLEHGAWVALEDIFLIASCRQGIREMRGIAQRQASLELTNEIVEAEVVARTASLEASEERFNVAVAGSHDGLWDWDIQSGKVYYSPRFMAMIGYGPDELAPTYDAIAELMHPYDSDRIVEDMQQHLAHQGPFDVELRFRCKSGEYRWFRLRGQALWDTADHAYRMAGSLSDISAQKAAADALRQSEQRFQTFMDNSPAVAFMKNAAGRYIYVNRPYEEMFRERFPTLVDRTDAELYPSDVVEQLRANDRIALESNSACEMVETAPLPNGEIRHWLSAKFPVLDASGEVFVGGVAVDITARVNAERDLREAVAEAEAANRSKSEFLANMSHEIRTPMTAILGHSELLLAPEQGPSDRLNSVQVIQRNGEHLLQLINDILDLSKIEAGKMTTERTSCSPCAVITDVASMMRVRAISKNLYFDVEYIGLIPETIKSDPTRLRQILLNLVGNSLKFTARGGVRIICSLAPTPAGAPPKLQFTVADTGVGLTEEQIRGLFSPFAQADSSTTRRFGGTGLGLTISKRLANAMGGDITVQSLYGSGSSFTLTIDTGPLDGITMLDSPREADLAGPLSAEPAPAANQPLRLRGRRILLAEDGPDNQFLISLHLTKQGATVEVAENGRLAVEKALAAVANNEMYDLILMDMQMPEMDGYTATSKLRMKGYRAPIIALTAHAMTGDREKCITAGCDDYTTKPIDKQHLIKLAHDYIERFRQTGEAANTLDDSQTEDAPPLPSIFADDADMSEAIIRFVARLSEKMEAMSFASTHQDRAQLGVLAHQLKGSAGGYGYAPIGQAAAALETAVKQSQDWHTIHERLEDLKRICARAQAPAATSSKRAVTT